MKNLLLIILLITAKCADANAQATPVTGQVNFNAGAYIFPDWSINGVLEQNNLPTINSFSYYVGWNADISYKDFYILPELGVGFSSNRLNNSTSSLYSIIGSISVGYNIITKPDYKLKVGGIFTSLPTRLALYNNDADMDLSNISLANPSGKVELNTNPMALGVFVGTELFANSTFPLGVSLSYQSNINNPQWNNSYGQTINPINETTNLISCKIFIPMKKWYKN